MDGSQKLAPNSLHLGNTPAQQSADLRSLLCLSMLPGIGPRTLCLLLEHFGTANEVLAASSEQLAVVSGVGPKLIHTIRTADHFVDPDHVLAWCDEHNVEVLQQNSAAYPQGLLEQPDAPPILFSLGLPTGADRLAVAIVGTRHATSYGTRQADRLAYGLAKAGVTVVSGLARGIDAAAHEGAIAAGGRTIAILGGGLGQLYPAEHEGLAKAIAADGAVLSEYRPDAKPRSGMFPQRNRLIAGMSLATLVIEAPDRSGALITARMAGEMGREVLALPGPVTSRASRGTNQLIREGATLVQTVDDVLEAIGPMGQAVTVSQDRVVRNPAELKLNDLERKVLESVEPSNTSIDQVIAVSGLPAHQVMATLSVLEMRKLIRRLSGQYVSRI
ncbi:DNA-protecting protein DprA [Rhodopirellula baltica]|nr:DNA-protecting protein DprA [Rhodopirellula baltica]